MSEVGFSARSVADHDVILALLERLIPIVMPVRAEQIARATQRQLVESARHRSAGVANLLIAAAAQASGLTVLDSDSDSDSDVIASVTGQRVEWIVSAGTAD